MSQANTVLAAMRTGCIYRVCDLAASTRLSTNDVWRVLSMLERGGLVESANGDGYRRKKLYTTRQQALPI